MNGGINTVEFQCARTFASTKRSHLYRLRHERCGVKVNVCISTCNNMVKSAQKMSLFYAPPNLPCLQHCFRSVVRTLHEFLPVLVALVQFIFTFKRNCLMKAWKKLDRTGKNPTTHSHTSARRKCEHRLIARHASPTVV